MAKTRKPKTVSVPTVDLHVGDATMPVDHVTAGYAPGDQINVRFSSSARYVRERAMLRGQLAAARRQGLKLRSGRPVDSYGAVVVYMLERMADSCDLPLNL
jgi:hypothetical protein